MPVKYACLVFIYLTALAGCTIEKHPGYIHIYKREIYKVSPSGYIALKASLSSLARKKTVETEALISTTHLYVAACDSSRWFKFAPDGRVLIGYQKQVPTKPAMDSGVFGGYYSSSDGKLKIETVFAAPGEKFEKLRIEGILSGDSITFFKDRVGKLSSNAHYFTEKRNAAATGCAIYIKSQQVAQLAAPDW